MNILPGACIDKFFAGQVYSVFPPGLKRRGGGLSTLKLFMPGCIHC